MAWIACVSSLPAEDGFELPPIRYSTSPSTDPVSRLIDRNEAGQIQWQRDPKFGLLPSLLRELDVPLESQVLVFSKTSLQIHKISPSNPRALYFNDSVYIGYVPGSDTLELAANDVRLGAVFYTLNSQPDELDAEDTTAPIATPEFARPRIVRDRGQCLSCHATTRTENVPGYLVRSIFSDRAGRPRTGSSSYTTDDRSPWKQRWGGWYVTGTHGSMRHMGNAFAIDRDDPQKIDLESGANQTSLPARVPSHLHPMPHSDLVALMVLEHQSRVHNLITRANYEATQAIAMDEAMNEALQRPHGHRSESTQRRILASANALYEAITFTGEVPLQSPVRGTSPFADHFAQRGPRTPDQHSLRDLDLNERLFRWRLSYLIYTPEFQQLPNEILTIVKTRLRQDLHPDPAAAHPPRWSDEERRVLQEILRETLPGWLDA
ncbi:MAG: hypothetical protein ACK5OB_09730 [Pirellula sp.]